MELLIKALTVLAKTFPSTVDMKWLAQFWKKNDADRDEIDFYEETLDYFFPNPEQKFKLQDIPLEKIKSHHDTDISKKLDNYEDEEYAQKMSKAKTFHIPPIILTGNFELVDGRHRTRASWIKKLKTIKAYMPI